MITSFHNGFPHLSPHLWKIFLQWSIFCVIHSLGFSENIPNGRFEWWWWCLNPESILHKLGCITHIRWFFHFRMLISLNFIDFNLFPSFQLVTIEFQLSSQKINIHSNETMIIWMCDNFMSVVPSNCRWIKQLVSLGFQSFSINHVHDFFIFKNELQSRNAHIS